MGERGTVLLWSFPPCLLACCCLLLPLLLYCCGRCPSLFQVANRFDATFGPVFSLKSSSDWELHTLFWMGQGKLARVLDNTRKRYHTPPHVIIISANKQLGLDICTYLVRKVPYSYFWYVRLKNALFCIFLVCFLLAFRIPVSPCLWLPRKRIQVLLFD